MTASLTLTGSVAALAAALQAFEAAQAKEYEGLNWHKMQSLDPLEAGEPDAGSRTVTPPVGNPPLAATPSTDTGAGTPQPMPSLSVPSGVAPTPTVPIPSMSPVSTTIPAIPTGEDEEDGDDTDGSGTDAEGLPWDARIHSSSKKKTAKGLWVAVRGGPKGAELAAIKDELRGVTQVPVPMPMPVIEQPVAAPVPMPMPVPMPVAAPAPEPVAAPLPMPMPTPAVEQPAPVAAAEEWDFAKLMAHIGPKMGTVIDPQYLAQVCQHYGIGAITDTATKPELIGQIVAQFQADGKW